MYVHPTVPVTLQQEPQLSGLPPHCCAALIWASDIELSLVMSVNTAGAALQEPISISKCTVPCILIGAARESYKQLKGRERVAS